MHVSPLGDRVYVSNRGHDSIAIFEVEADGQLVRVAIRPCGGRWPRNFTIAPGNRFLLVANQQSDEVVVLPVCGGSEVLGTPIASAVVTGGACVRLVTTPQV
jgi:6-phosphogluconolactonase